MNTKKILSVLLFLCFTLLIPVTTYSQKINVDRAVKNYDLVISGKRKIESFSKDEQFEILVVFKYLENEKKKSKGQKFEVVLTIPGCKYFIGEQLGNYSLIDSWVCFKPKKGEIGFGDIGSYGLKDVTLDGLQCSVWVEDWLLSSSRAVEKMVDKCN